MATDGRNDDKVARRRTSLRPFLIVREHLGQLAIPEAAAYWTSSGHRPKTAAVSGRTVVPRHGRCRPSVVCCRPWPPSDRDQQAPGFLSVKATREDLGCGRQGLGDSRCNNVMTQPTQKEIPRELVRGWVGVGDNDAGRRRLAAKCLEWPTNGHVEEVAGVTRDIARLAMLERETQAPSRGSVRRISVGPRRTES